MNACHISAKRSEEVPFTEEHYKQMADSIPQLAWMCDPDGWIFWYNKRWYDYTGTTFEEMQGWGWQKLHDPNLLEGTVQRFQKALKLGLAWEDTFPLKSKAGQWRWFLSRAFPIHDKNGKIIRWFGTNTDITDQLNAQKLITNQERRQRFLNQLAHATQSLSNADDIIVTTARLLGEYLQVNRCAYAEVESDEDHFKLTGNYTQGVKSIIGRYPFSAFGKTVLRLMREGNPYIVHDVDHDEQVLPEDLAAYRETQIQAVIYVPLLKEGKLAAAMAIHQAQVRQWTIEEIELVRLVVARCWEALERARITRNLTMSEQRYKALFNSIDQGFCIIEMIDNEEGQTINYHYIETNPAFEQHTGIKNALNKTILDFDPNHETYWFKLYGDVAKTGIPKRMVQQALNGQWFEVSAFRIGMADEKKIAVLFNNVTKRKEAELLLKESDRNFRNMADSINQMIWVTRPDGYHEYYNRRWYEYTGVKSGSNDGEGWNAILHVEDQPRALERWHHSLATGEPYEIEYRLHRADGACRMYER